MATKHRIMMRLRTSTSLREPISATQLPVPKFYPSKIQPKYSNRKSMSDSTRHQQFSVKPSNPPQNRSVQRRLQEPQFMLRLAPQRPRVHLQQEDKPQIYEKITRGEKASRIYISVFRKRQLKMTNLKN